MPSHVPAAVTRPSSRSPSGSKARVKRRGDRRFVGNVEREREPAAGVGDGARAELVAVGDSDEVAFARQQIARGLADAACAAGHDRGHGRWFFDEPVIGEHAATMRDPAVASLADAGIGRSRGYGPAGVGSAVAAASAWRYDGLSVPFCFGDFE